MNSSTHGLAGIKIMTLIYEEILAVRDIENPVRALNGHEPRYTYTSIDSNGETSVTASILKPTEVKKGAWVYCKNDPREMIKYDQR